jgi:Trk K+ transport system NAD-binding subunit
MESFWSTIVYLVSGFENRVPLTTWGKAISIVGMLGGAFTGILVTVVLTARKVDKFLDRSGRHMNYNDHIAIIGWNDRGRGVLAEVLGWGKTAIVLSREDEETVRNTVHQQATHLTVIAGDPCASANYERLHLDTARSVIVLSTKVDGRNPDDVTLGIVLGVQDIASKTRRAGKRLHIVAELTDANRSEELRRRGADEVICTSDLQQRLLINAAVNPGVATFFEDLLCLSDKSNEAYTVAVPEAFHGWTYKDVCNWLVLHPKPGDPVFPMGVVRRDGTFSSDPNDPHRVSGDDSLIVVAFNENSIKFFDTLTREDVAPSPEPLPGWILRLERWYRRMRTYRRSVLNPRPRPSQSGSAGSD